jgi:hypothetical protein
MPQLTEQKGLSVTGGILAGQTWLTSLSYTWPLVSCTVSHDAVTFTTWCPPRFRFYIPKKSIRKLVLKNYRIAGFLRIIHDLENVPPYIRFGTFEPHELKHALEAFGFKL